jgi:hypothetical protein
MEFWSRFVAICIGAEVAESQQFGGFGRFRAG